jgi:hypothetical protein
MLQFKDQMPKIKVTFQNAKRLQVGLMNQATTRIRRPETKKRDRPVM